MFCHVICARRALRSLPAGCQFVRTISRCYLGVMVHVTKQGPSAVIPRLTLPATRTRLAPWFAGDGGWFALAGRPCLSRWPGWLRCSPCGPAPRSSGHHHGIDRSLFRAISSAQFASVLTCMPISARMSRACAPAGIRTCAIREVYEAALEAGILD